MQGWAFRARTEGWVAELADEERAALVDLVDDVVELLAPGDRPQGWAPPWPGPASTPTPTPTSASVPSDPALRRLLPDASRADAEVAAEFRRLTEDDLRHAKVANLVRLREALVAGGPAVVVDPRDAPGVAAALTDLRLVLAERLGIRTEAEAEAVHRLAVGGGPLDLDDPDAVARTFLAIVSTLLSVLQESLVELMLDALPEHGSDRGEPPGPRR